MELYADPWPDGADVDLEHAAATIAGTPLRAGRGGPVLGTITGGKVVDGALVVDVELDAYVPLVLDPPYVPPVDPAIQRLIDDLARPDPYAFLRLTGI